MPRKDRTFNDKDLARVYCKHLTGREQSDFRSWLATADCSKPVSPTPPPATAPSGPDPNVPILCQEFTELLGAAITALGSLLQLLGLVKGRLVTALRVVDAVLAVLAALPLIGELARELRGHIKTAQQLLETVSRQIENLVDWLNRINREITLFCSDILG